MFNKLNKMISYRLGGCIFKVIILPMVFFFLVSVHAAPQIAYVDGATFDLYVMDANGSNPTRLTNTDGVSEGNPKWPPNGNLIADHAGSKTDPYQIYTISKDGNNAQNLSNNTNIEKDPDWLNISNAINRKQNIPFVQDRIVVVNSPNPFVTSTQIRYSIPKANYVIISIYNNKGELLKVLENQKQHAGIHTISWNGKDKCGNQMASGQYYYQIMSGKFVATQKMVLQ